MDVTNAEDYLVNDDDNDYDDGDYDDDDYDIDKP